MRTRVMWEPMPANMLATTLARAELVMLALYDQDRLGRLGQVPEVVVEVLHRKAQAQQPFDAIVVDADGESDQRAEGEASADEGQMWMAVGKPIERSDHVLALVDAAPVGAPCSRPRRGS